MKKTTYLINIILFLILLIILLREDYPQRIYRKLFASNNYSNNYLNNYLNNYQWMFRENYFDQDTISHYEIVLIGNSITQGGLWEQLLMSNSIKNLGIGGDISSGVLKRLDRAIKYHPKLLFVEIGVNDINNNIPIDTILSNYSKIVSRIKATKIITGITSVIFVGKEYPNAVAINQKIDQLNKKLMLLSKDNIYFINLNQELATDGFLKTNFTYDQIHLTPKGYLSYSKKLNNFIIFCNESTQKNGGTVYLK